MKFKKKNRFLKILQFFFVVEILDFFDIFEFFEIFDDHHHEHDNVVEVYSSNLLQ